MPHIKANNINIYYEFEGKGEPLVIIGGFASDSRLWKDFVKPLQGHFKVLYFDHRGFGDSDVPPPPYSVEMMAKDTVELMNQLNIDSAYIFGHSMGSALLQTMCLKNPEKIKKAILSGTFLKIPYTSQMLFETVSKLFEKNLDQDIISQMIMPWIYSSAFLKNPNNFNKVLESMSKRTIDPKGYEGQSIALKNFDSTTWISKIKTEILILAGKEDIDTPLYCTQAVHEKLKNAKLKILDDAAHMMYREHPKKTHEIILDFFK